MQQSAASESSRSFVALDGEHADVMRAKRIAADAIVVLAARYRLTAIGVEAGAPIPGSYWGDPEAGLIGERLYWRADTPLHSLLHEIAHFACMDGSRRGNLDTNAGGDDAEECAVCYLQVLLADSWKPFGTGRCLSDMDRWGYSFREGSATAWFNGDGRAARSWLLGHRLIRNDSTPSWRLRT